MARDPSLVEREVKTAQLLLDDIEKAGSPDVRAVTVQTYATFVNAAGV